MRIKINTIIQSHEIDYEIKGHDVQLVEVELDPGETVIAEAGGTVIEKQLNNETLRVDTGCIVGFETSIDYSIEQAGGLRSMVFGGEGIFLATLRGTGKVWLQSMPIRKLIAELSPRGGNTRKEARGGLLDSILEG